MKRIPAKRILVCASRVSHILNFHLPYIEYFKKKGYAVDIAVQGTTIHPLIDHCYDLTFTKNPLSPDNIGTVFRLKKILEQNDYALVYSNTTLASVAVRMALMLMHGAKPYCVHISHGYMFAEKNNLRQKLILQCEKMTKKPIDELVVMNQEDYDLAQKYHLGKNLHYIYGMGLCGDHLPPISAEQRDQMRRTLGAEENTKILACVGEFSDRKNQAAVIETFDRLQKKYHHLRLVFAGEGKLLDECKQLVESKELTHKVRFLGYVDDVNTLYRSVDVLVSASKMEGLPFNVLEALYCGTVVALSDIKGHRDLIADGQNGILFDGNDSDEMYTKLDELFSDDERYRSIQSHSGLEEKYLIECVRPTLLKILDTEYNENPAKNEERVY